MHFLLNCSPQDRHAHDPHGRGRRSVRRRGRRRHDALHAHRHRRAGRHPEGAPAAAARHELKRIKTACGFFNIPSVKIIWSFRDAVWAEKLFNQPCNFLLPQPIPPLPRCDKNQLILDPIPWGCFWREAGPIYYCDKDLTYWLLHNECCAWKIPPLSLP